MAGTKRNAIAQVAVLLATGAVCQAGSLPRFSGSIIGFVSDAAGVPQVGATVMLFNRYERMLVRTLTNEKGSFGFDLLVPDVYSIRVSQPSFVPATKGDILVEPGVRNFLTVSLASLFSSVELVYSAPAGPVMSDDWKWVLRGSSATRPVLRIRSRGVDISSPSEKSSRSSIFSGTRGLVRVSAGDEGSGGGVSPDMGTTFALATSVFGNNRVQVAGNVGYSSYSGAPTAGFRTTITRDDGSGWSNPGLQLTMRQMSAPAHAAANVASSRGDATAPTLRTMAATFQDKLHIGQALLLEYGTTLENIQYLDRLNYVSPYARLSYNMGSKGLLELGYSSGQPPADFAFSGAGPEADLQRDMAEIAMFPRLTLAGGRVRMQRSNTFEASYQIKSGSRTYTVGAYRETVSNAALMMSSPTGTLPTGDDYLPDAFSESSIFNIGRLHATGLSAAVTQEVDEHLNLTLAYGDGGVLRTEGRQLQTTGADELRSMIRSSQQQWVMGKVSGTVPFLGTRFVSSYLWTDYRALTPYHRFITRGAYPEAGFNVYFRQPIPGVPGMPGRLEATADLRNMMAQGYLPISTATGQKLLLIHSPRSVRGGLNFIF
jgi:hypothetical protein